MNTAIHSSPDLEELYRNSENDLLRYFYRRHGVGDEAKDLVQETFVQFTKSLRGGQKMGFARGYLFGIARHLSQRVWARRKHGAVLPLDEDSANVATPEPDDRIEAAREIIASLPTLQREILDLRFSQDLSYAEMAEVLSIPVGTVRSRLHNAIAELRIRLDADIIPIPMPQ